MSSSAQIQSPSENWRLTVVCPKCHSADTRRTGAFNVQPVPLFNYDDGRQRVELVFDRRCQHCGYLFAEQS